MADSRSKSTLERLEEAIAQLASSQLNVTERIEELLLRVANLEHASKPSTSPSSSSPNPAPNTTYNPPKMKLDVPKFDGTDPSGWVFKITQFFAYHSTPEPERLTIASFAMEGPALAWFQWMTRNHQLPTWAAFLQAIEMCFAHGGSIIQLKGDTSQHLEAMSPPQL